MQLKHSIVSLANANHSNEQIFILLQNNEDNRAMYARVYTHTHTYIELDKNASLRMMFGCFLLTIQTLCELYTQCARIASCWPARLLFILLHLHAIAGSPHACKPDSTSRKPLAGRTITFIIVPWAQASTIAKQHIFFQFSGVTYLAYVCFMLTI